MDDSYDYHTYQKLNRFLTVLNQKVSERSTARNDYTKGYFMLERAGHQGFATDKLELICKNLNIPMPDSDVVRMMQCNNISYNDIRMERYPFHTHPNLNRCTYIPSLAELGIKKHVNNT